MIHHAMSRCLLFSGVIFLAGPAWAQVAQQPKGAKKAALAGEQKKLPPADHAAVKYGPHPRNVFDLWLPKTDRPAPLVLYIHGGGFRGGDKSSLSPMALEQFLKEGW